jgi:hypothetical protein
LQTWSATEKDVKDTTVMEELPHVFRRFWPMISFFTILLAGVIVMSTNLVPFQWQITQIFVIIPLLCTALPHLLYITVLNRESLCRLRAFVGRSLTPFAPLLSLQPTWPVSSSETSLRTFACFSLSLCLSPSWSPPLLGLLRAVPLNDLSAPCSNLLCPLLHFQHLLYHRSALLLPPLVSGSLRPLLRSRS